MISQFEDSGAGEQTGLRECRRPFRALNVILISGLTILVAFGLFGEKIPIEDGLGWDGKSYGEIAKDFPEYVQSKQLGSYLVSRVLPSAVVWSGLRLLGVDRTKPHIINGFLALNCACIYLAFYYFNGISRHLRFSQGVHVIGFASLFLTYPVLKMCFYYPVLTDVPAFCLGVATLNYYLKSRTLPLVVVTLLGSFVYPTMLYTGLLLLLYSPTPLLIQEGRSKAVVRFVGLVLAGVFMSYVISVFYVRSGLWTMNATTELARTNETLFPVSILLASAYIYLVVLKTIGNDSFFGHPIRGIQLNRLVLVLAIFVLVRGSYWLMQNDQPSFGYKDFAFQTIRQSIAEPLIFLVSHVLYFGPILLLFFLFHKSVFVELRQWGVAIGLFAAGYLVVGIGSESRQFVNAIPVFCLALCSALRHYRIDWKLVSLLVFFQLVFSRFWYRINVEPFHGRYTEFPFQHYFMVHGPWMSEPMYFVQTTIVLLTFITVYLAFRSKQRIDVAS